MAKTIESKKATKSPKTPKTPETETPTATPKEKKERTKLPRAKRLGVVVGKVMRSVANISKILKGHSTEPGIEALSNATLAVGVALLSLRTGLDALPDTALARKTSYYKSTAETFVVGQKVSFTDKGKENFKDLLSPEELATAYEVEALAGKLVRIKNPKTSGTLFAKAGLLASVK